MLNIQNMSFSIKEKKSSMKIYFSVLLFFLVTGMDGYACDKKGHIKFHNYTHIPITVTAGYMKGDIFTYEKKIVRAKTTSGGICWYSKEHGHLIRFDTSFNYKSKTTQGPNSQIGINEYMKYCEGNVLKYENNKGYITGSGCRSIEQYTICTVDLKIKK